MTLNLRCGKKIDMNLPNNTKNISNLRFGRLVAISPTDERKNTSVVWTCVCDCGNHCRKPVKSLTSGKSRSCGCLEKQNRTANMKTAAIGRTKSLGEASFNALMISYKQSARTRNLEFKLSSEQFRSLTSSRCYYCGQQPSNIRHEKHRNGDYVYNGIDRKDSSVGYTLNNCVPCCSTCNYAKRDMSQKEFLQWIKRVYNHQHLRED